MVLGALLKRFRFFKLTKTLLGLRCLARKLRSEGVWRAFECLSYSSLSEIFIEDVILARVAIASASDAVEPTRKALTVQLQALTVPTITTTELFRWSDQALFVWLVGVKRDIISLSVKIWQYI